MATDPSSKPTFSRGRKWTIGFNVVLAVVVVLAFAAMAIYLSGHYPKHQRFYLSSTTAIKLSPRTVSLLHSLTNDIKVTLYYDTRSDDDSSFYRDIAELLREYNSVNKRIKIRTVDYYLDPGAAQLLKTQYDFGSSTNRDLVIFDCGGRVKIVNGASLLQTQFEALPSKDPQRPEFRKKPIAFHGESAFTGAILTVMNPKPLAAYFLQGHGEHLMEDNSETGFAKFIALLKDNHIDSLPLTLLGTNTVPIDCNLLIVAGPRDPVPQTELDRIDQYLNEGGRLLVMFNLASTGQETGLEKILSKWGIQVSSGVVKDPDNTTVGTDVIVGDFSQHPAVNPLIGSRIQMIMPRLIGRIELSNDSLRVDEIAFSGPRSFLQNGGTTQTLGRRPLMVTTERTAAAKGALSERGLLRILVLGDSLFLGNRQIESGANRDFATYAANWLLDRNALLQGVGPRNIVEYRLLISKTQMQTLEWILLGAMPGGILLLGGIVWLSRRK